MNAPEPWVTEVTRPIDPDDKTIKAHIARKLIGGTLPNARRLFPDLEIHVGTPNSYDNPDRVCLFFEQGIVVGVVFA